MGGSEMLGFKGPPGDGAEDVALGRFMESKEFAKKKQAVADAEELGELWEAVNELSELLGEFMSRPLLWR